MYIIVRILYNFNKLHVISVSVIVILFGFLITIDNPLDQSEHELVAWIQTATNKDAIFFGPETEIDTFKIRVFAKRAIWADDAFPFHEDYIKEFDRRRKIISNIESLSMNDLMNLARLEKIDYYITNRNKIRHYAESDPAYINDRYVVYVVSENLKTVQDKINARKN